MVKSDLSGVLVALLFAFLPGVNYLCAGNVFIREAESATTGSPHAFLHEFSSLARAFAGD